MKVRRDITHIANSLEESAMFWHERLGHLNMVSLKELHAMVDGMNLKEVPLHHICEGCVKGKHKKTSFPKDGATRASQLLEIVHTDWGGDANERRSTTVYVFFVGVGAVSWNCKRQLTIALSTTEAEYMATSQCTKEAIWLRKFMADVGLVQNGATNIMCDNQGCIALAKNPTHHSRTKHINIHHSREVGEWRNRPRVLPNSRYGDSFSLLLDTSSINHAVTNSMVRFCMGKVSKAVIRYS